MANGFRDRARLRALKIALEGARRLEQVAHWVGRRSNERATSEDARALTEWRYARMPEYTTAWHRESGLFDFERNAIDRFFPKPPAHLLVHGAGGGREVSALLDLGYRITAAEPVAKLAADARRALGARARIVDAGLETTGSAFPERFDGVIVGWSAYGHLVDGDVRVSALRALLKACPSGPMLLSWREGPRPGLKGTAQTVSAAAKGIPTGGARVASHFGLFHVMLDEQTLRDEATRAGLRLLWFGSYADSGYPHAVLGRAEGAVG